MPPENADKQPVFINPFKKYHTLNIPEGVARYRGVSPGAKLLYGRLQRYAGAKGVAFPHIEDLAEEVGMGTTQTKAYIAELIEHNLIHRQRAFAKGNVYAFLDHPCLKTSEIGDLRSNRAAFSSSKQPPSESRHRASNGRDAVPQSNGRDAVPLTDGMPSPCILLSEEGHIRGSVTPKSPLDSANEPTETLTDPDADPELEAALAEEITRGTRDRQRRIDARDRAKAAKRDAKHADNLARREQMRALEDRGRAREEAGRPATIGTLEDAHPHPEAAQASEGSVARNVSLPEEAEAWNELVTAGVRITAFDWEMQEGLDLRRCREHPKFTLSAWRTVCKKANVAISNECGWVTFRWLIKKNDNWWKVLQGEYDTYRPREKSKSEKRSDFIERKVRESDERKQRRLAEAAATN